MQMRSLSRLLSEAKMSTGRLMLRMDFPERMFLPILVRTNLRTPFWSSIFFLLT